MFNLFSSSKPSFLNPSFSVFIEKDKEWRWFIKNDKGDIIASSTRNFANKNACLTNLKLLGDKILLFCGNEKPEK